MMYQIVKNIVRPFFYFFWGIRLIGKENLKGIHRAIVISNHRSNNDPITLHIIMRPKLYFMAKEELFRNAFLSGLIRWFGAFSVSRGSADLNSIKECFRLLRDDKVIGIFPEGTRSKDGVIRKFHPGVAMIALRTKVPVIPVYISGDYKMFHRNNVYVGKAIDLNECVSVSESYQERSKEATEYLRGVIIDMQKKVQR